MAAVTLVAGLLSPLAQAGETLDAVKEKGFVQCGVSTPFPGFANTNEKGEWSGLDIDVCRAVATAVFGDPTKVKFTPLTAKERFTALQSGEIDMLSRNTTWTLTRDTALGLNFAGINYYDGQGFLVKKELGLDSAKQLDGASICIQTGTTTELNLADYFRSNDMEYEPVAYDRSDETVKAFEAGRCDVLTSDRSQLYSLRILMSEPDSAEVLPEVISKEPLGPLVRNGDEDWLKVVRWSLFAMIEAEDLGLTSENIDERAKEDNPAIKRFVGENTGEQGLPLDAKWAYNIVKQVGNYGESFERNIGQDSPLKIERGLNALWKDGGLQYAPPFR